MVQREQLREAFSRRLAQACAQANLDEFGRGMAIARALGVSSKAVSKWLNAESIPRQDKMYELAAFLGADVLWLQHGNEGVFSEESRESQHAASLSEAPVFYLPQAEAGFRIDVLDIEASAGPGSLISSDVTETINHIVYDSQEALELFGHRPASSIKVITVTGDSMSGTIELGDYIFVDIAKDYFHGDGIYVFLYKGQLLVKRLQMTHDSLLVRSDNPKYADWKICEDNEQHLKIIGRVMYSHSIKRHA
ncbi:helix-turn-helix transcriptional regulator [Enterobacter sp. R1(2018)]|uniref:LexA family transcriptional regulator n=1 Tax=Enterobacter sp. R1(2018) TaxID=2447891 RepID=UPI000EB364F8|nr:helix-turn-helix transcriptional regulator [Enterobacter sp. R1(2018)]RKQ40595.1 helix-turn-helix transcriptional regulator [Enterobacter sp. R1(2018)]